MTHHDHQVALDETEFLLPRIGLRQQAPDDAEQGVQLVQAAICFDADVIFGHAYAPMDTGRSVVSGPGVYFLILFNLIP